MHKFSLLILLSLLSSSVLGQQKKPVLLKVSTPTAICTACKARIEEYMKGEDGVIKVTVYPTSKYTNILYLADRTNPENIRTAIANVGYDADEIKADEDAYRELPKTCKKPEDGGHKKN